MRGVNLQKYASQKIPNCVKLLQRCKTGFEMTPQFGWDRWKWKKTLSYIHLHHFSLAECLKALGHMEVAAESYTKVVDMAPLHLEARLSLATLQQQLGRPECALKALESMYDSETLAQDSSAAQKARTHFLVIFQGCTTFSRVVLLSNHTYRSTKRKHKDPNMTKMWMIVLNANYEILIKNY